MLHTLIALSLVCFAGLASAHGLQQRRASAQSFSVCATSPVGLEARAGIEPTYEDLQSSAWPLCHRAAGPREGT